jgi:mono/diheme cytochrome c family protein
MKYVLTIIIVLLALGLGVILYAWSGRYNIAATQPHWALTSSLIELLRDRSIAAHSDHIKVPNLDNEKLIKIGFYHYHEMCRLCHGAPGYKREEFAQGLYPAPPKLASGDIQKRLDAAKIYWVVKYGIKMTGMPAFGPTHDEQELWGIVAMVKEVPQMSPEQYRQLVQTTSSGSERDH